MNKAIIVKLYSIVSKVVVFIDRLGFCRMFKCHN